MGNIPAILAVLTLLVSVPLNWYATFRLIQLSRRSPNKVLRDRAIAAFALAVIVTVFALIFWQNDQLHPPLSGEATKVITRVAVFVWSLIPAVVWLRIYRRNKL